MRLLRTLLLLVMTMGFASAGWFFGALEGTYMGIVFWSMSGGAFLMTSQ